MLSMDTLGLDAYGKGHRLGVHIMVVSCASNQVRLDFFRLFKPFGLVQCNYNCTKLVSLER